MNEPKLHIARNGLELGVLSAGDARELLAAGFLQPTDEFWTDDNPTRRPASEIAPSAPGKSSSWVVRTRSSVINAGATVRERASKTVVKVSAMASRNKAAVAVAAEQMLEGYLPKLRELVGRNFEQSFHVAKSALRDETFLRRLFGAVYDCLPRPARRFVGEEFFVEFCLKHRRKLLD